jgi:hypothetical protein
MKDHTLCTLADQLQQAIYAIETHTIDSDTRLMLMYDIGRTLILIRALSLNLSLSGGCDSHGLN